MLGPNLDPAIVDANHGRAGEAHLAARRRRQRADEEIIEGRPGMCAATDPAADDMVALGDEIGCAAEAEILDAKFADF